MTRLELTSGRLNPFFCEHLIRYQDGTLVDPLKTGVEVWCSVRVPAKGVKCPYHRPLDVVRELREQ